MQVIKERVSRKLSSTREYFLRSHENRRFWGCYTKVSLLPPSLLNPKRSYTSRVCCCIEKSRSVFLTWYHNLVALKEFTNLRICLCSLIDLRKNVKSLKLSLRGSDEIQAQHWPYQLCKPRTGSVRTDRCVNRVHNRCTTRGRIGAETGRPLDRYSVREYILELV